MSLFLRENALDYALNHRNATHPADHEDHIDLIVCPFSLNEGAFDQRSDIVEDRLNELLELLTTQLYATGDPKLDVFEIESKKGHQFFFFHFIKVKDDCSG